MILWTVSPVTFTLQRCFLFIAAKQYSIAARNVTVMSALRAAMIIYSQFFIFLWQHLIGSLFLRAIERSSTILSKFLIPPVQIQSIISGNPDKKISRVKRKAWDGPAEIWCFFVDFLRSKQSISLKIQPVNRGIKIFEPILAPTINCPGLKGFFYFAIFSGFCIRRQECFWVRF